MPSLMELLVMLYHFFSPSPFLLPVFCAFHCEPLFTPFVHPHFHFFQIRQMLTSIHVLIQHAWIQSGEWGSTLSRTMLLLDSIFFVAEVMPYVWEANKCMLLLELAIFPMYGNDKIGRFSITCHRHCKKALDLVFAIKINNSWMTYSSKRLFRKWGRVEKHAVSTTFENCAKYFHHTWWFIFTRSQFIGMEFYIHFHYSSRTWLF